MRRLSSSVSGVTSWMFTKLRSSFTQKPERNSRATIERVAFSRSPWRPPRCSGVTSSPTTTVEREREPRARHVQRELPSDSPRRASP
jgi:hypothetical protein